MQDSLRLSETSNDLPTEEDPALIEPGLWIAIRRFWWLPVILLVVLGAIGGFLGYKRSPRYSATTRITVASVNFQTQSVPGFVQAVETLTSSYSQIVVSPNVLGPLAKARGTTEAALANAITATPAPESTLFSITAKQDSPRQAISLVNAAAQQTRRYIGTLDSSSATAAGVLRRYRVFAHQEALAQTEVDNLRQQQTGATATTGSGITPASNATSSSKLTAAETRLAEATTQAAALSAQYEDIISGQNPAKQARLLSILTPAVTATSDRSTYVQRFIVIGAAGGLVIGVLLALLFGRPRPPRVHRPR